VLALPAAASLLLFVTIMRYSAYGFDFTDEGFYLVWIKNPFLYDYSYPITNFGFIYHPVFILFDGNIAALRQFNITFTFLLSWNLAYLYIKELAPLEKENPLVFHAIAIGIAAGSFLVLVFLGWLPTPSYNHLVLQALLIASIGLLLTNSYSSKICTIGWLLLGIGGWLTFMAKPSSALLLSVTVLVYLLATQKFSLRHVALAASTAVILLLISTWFISGSLAGFVTRLQTGFDMAYALQANHTITSVLRLDLFRPDKKDSFIFLSIIALTFGIIAITQKFRATPVILSVAFFSAILFLSIGATETFFFKIPLQKSLVFYLSCATFIAALWTRKNQILKLISRSHWITAILFLAMPRIASFGTNNNYWIQDTVSVIFLLLFSLAPLTALIKAKKNVLLFVPPVLAFQVIITFLIHYGMANPYRQPAIFSNQSILSDVPSLSSLILAEDTAIYIEDALAVAQNAGFKPNTPVIDLSGQSPGLIYALDAENTGYVWIFGGYPGSQNFAREVLNRTSCEKISTSWLLLEPNGPRSIPDIQSLLADFGLNIAEHYRAAGSWETAKDAGGYPEPREQILYAPLAVDTVLRACLANRKKISD